MFVRNESGVIVRLENIKTAESYTESEVLAILSANTGRQYDCVVDRLYFQGDRKQCKNRCEYSFFTARVLERKENQELKNEILLKFLKAD